MSGTKIINVLRDDKLDDILHILRTTPAQEVIFVLPRKTRAFSKEEGFSILADESRELGKTILVLSESPEINALASSYNFGILTSSQNDDEDQDDQMGEEEIEDENYREKPISNDDDFEDIEGKTDEDGNEDSNRFIPVGNDESGEPNILLTASPKAPKSMNDILQPKSSDSININVKVNKKVEKPINVQLKKDAPPYLDQASEKNALNEIQNVWQSRRSSIVRSPAPSLKLPGFSLGPIVSKLSKKMIWLYGGIVFVVFGFVIFISTGKAEITIKPQAHTLDFHLDVSVSDGFTTVDLESRKIPGQLFSIEKKVEESFNSTGEKDVVQKARGKITVYNEYGTTPQVLIATTRFESETGLVFRTLKTVTVPGTKVQNGNITPGSIDVEIIADKAGDAYNISAGKFTIPAFKEKGDMDRYGKFYGRSVDQMKGGIIGKAKVVTEQDYINAKNKIEERILSEAEQELKVQASGLKMLELPKPAIKEITPSAAIDEATDSFKVSGTAEISTVAFKESDLQDLISKYVQSKNNVVVLPEKINLKFEEIKYDGSAKVLDFKVVVTGSAYGTVNEEKIIMDLMGKGENDIKNYLKNVEGVASARVRFTPFWVWKVPNNREKIELELDYN